MAITRGTLRVATTNIIAMQKSKIEKLHQKKIILGVTGKHLSTFKFFEVENSRKAFQEMRAIIYKYYPFQKWGEKKTHKYYLVEKHVNSLHIFSQANTSVPTENTSF